MGSHATASASSSSRTAAAASATIPLRILCLGDSLTGGYPSGNWYACRLQERLQAVFSPSTHDVEIEVDGQPGDLVTGRGSFARRMEAMWRMQEAKGKGSRFDWTIVLGGTNDIAWGHSADEVLPALENIWDIPLSRGGKVLALTIPETKFKSAALDLRRGAINDGIRAYKKQNYYTFDLFNAVTYHSMPPEDRPKYWLPDGVHFTAAGYDLIGDKVADCLIRILHLEEAQSTEISSIAGMDARQRKMIQDLIYEEERGNPKLLSQGWIVVRKRDLD